MSKFFLAVTTALAALFISGQAWAGKDLDAIRARGVLICGPMTTGLAGFMDYLARVWNERRTVTRASCSSGL